MSETFPSDPSATAGNQYVSPNQKLHEAMERVLPIFELEGGEFELAAQTYVRDRAAELSADAPKNSVGYAHGGTEHFIGPDRAMVASAMLGRAFYMDDNSAYTAAFPFVKSLYPQMASRLPQDKAYLNAVIGGANYGQAVYFESVKGDEVSMMRALEDFVDLDAPSQPEASIREFKKSAVCQQRAGVAHNTLQIFGVTSRLVNGDLEVAHTDGSNSREHHAFLLVEGTDGRSYIFDPTHPVQIKNHDNGVVHLKPSVYPLQDSSSRELSVTLKEFSVQDGQQTESHSYDLIYHIGND